MSGRRRSRGGIQVIHVLRAWEDVEGIGQLFLRCSKACQWNLPTSLRDGFTREFRDNAPHLRRGKCCAWHSSRNLTQSGKKGSKGTERLRRCQWYAAAVVPLLQGEDDPMECDNRAVGAERGVNSERMKLTVTHLLGNKRRKWQGNN